jgi:hypothetical protein
MHVERFESALGKHPRCSSSARLHQTGSRDAALTAGSP